MSAPQQILAFDAAATRVLQRVTLRRWLVVLARTLLWAVAAVVVSMVLQLAGVVGAGFAFFLIVLWLGGCAVWTWRHKPGRYEALALWDKTQNRSEAFAAAWWFEQQSARLPAHLRHIEAQRSALEQALPQLARDLPLSLNRWLWAVPVIACLGLVGSVFQHANPKDEPLTEAMKQAVVREASGIAQAGLKKKLEGLTDQEKKDIEKLKQDIQNTAKDLQANEGKSARDVLGDLEKRARDAEKLAQRLSNDKDAWASDKLVNEMRKHADTADLGDAVANKNAAQTAKAATDLAAQLKSPQLTAEVRDRMTESLKEIKREADQQDRQRTAGSHVIAAAEQMELSKAPEAAEEFEKLAEKMKDMARREQTRKELDKLAQQLRDAGSRMTGNDGGGMKQMAGAGESPQQGPQGQNGQQQQQMLNQQSMSQQQLQPPGLTQQGQQQMMMQPSPSTATGQQQQMTMAQAQGQMQPGQSQGKPMLLAPIPGAKPDEQPKAFIIGPDAPKDPNGPTIGIMTPGGQQAGNATAKLNADKTAAQKAGQTSMVNAKQGTEGQSTTRSVEGGIRQENAARTSQQTAIDFIQQQEEALDDSTLPPARREQVRRYFTELRKRFEAAEK